MPQISGKKISLDADGVLNVPNHPIISIVADDLSVWQTIQPVFDKAIAQSYGDDKSIVWQVVSESDEAIGFSCVNLRINKSETNILSLFYSGMLLMKRLEWNEAASLLRDSVDAVLQNKIIPQGAEFFDVCEQVNLIDFCETVVDYIDGESTLDVEVAQYDALAAKFKEEFESATDNTVEIAKKAMEKARKKLTEAGQFTEEKGEQLKEFLENDLSRVAQGMKKDAQMKLNPARLGTGALASMSKLLHKTGVVLASFADKADASLACKSGEITSAGKLVCKACGHQMNFKKTGRIPPCPKCHKTDFTKGY